MTYPYLMPGVADAAADPPVTTRPGYSVDNRETVIGPLPKAAPPVLGDWAVDDSRSNAG